LKQVVFVLCLAGCSFSKLQAQEIQLITPKLIDLGKVHEGITVDGKIEFVNSGKKPFTVKKIRTSCGCTATQIEKEIYATGDTAQIHFSIDTRGFRRVVRKTITVLFQEEGMENLKYTLQMHVFSELELSPRFISFRHIPLNPDTVITEYFSVQNNSEKSVLIKKVSSNCDLVEVFPKSVTIPPNKEHLLRVELRPKRKEQRSVSIYIETDHKQKSQILQPVYVQIEG
jgi:hypothetical protein